MKWLLALWIMTIVGLAGTYSHVVDLQKYISDQEDIIIELKTEVAELKEKNDTWYMDQIKRWVPYDATQVTVIKHIQRNSRLMEHTQG